MPASCCRQKVNRLSSGTGAPDIDQARLNDRITSLSDPPVAAGYGVTFQHMIVTQDVLDAADRNECAQCTAATIAVSQIIGPTTGCAERDRRSLFAGVTHRSNLINELGAHRDAANL